MLKLRIRPATTIDPAQLAGLRAEAMRPSLEAVGRFDPDRARSRFLDTFCAQETWILRAEGQTAGFFVARRRPDHLLLDHLYLKAAFQGAGRGRQVVENLKSEARCIELPIRVTALTNSAAGRFYASCGFAPLSEDGIDTRYEWRPSINHQAAPRAAE